MDMGYESTARTRELGSDLRTARKKAGFSGIDMAGRLGWSTSKVSRLEHGRRGSTPVDVASYAASCGVVSPELDRLVALAVETDDEFWVQRTGERMPEELRSLTVLEQTSTTLTYFESVVIPGLLQTEDYTRALFHEATLLPEASIEPRVRMRMLRQKLLHRRTPPSTSFFVHENALRAVVGGNAVMHDQLLHLVLISELDNCAIRVVPAEAGHRIGLSGPFTHASSPNGAVVYVEQLTASLFLDGPANIRAYRAILRRLHDHALDAGQSRTTLAELASIYDRRE